MKARKILAMVAALALTAALAVGGTLAYLTSTKTVTNTFSVGNVQIKLDEALVTPDGKPVDPAQRVEGDATGENGNAYHLLPGHTYTKDPTVHVDKKSEPCYIRTIVTVSDIDALKAAFPVEDYADWYMADGTFLLEKLVSGWDASVWKCVSASNGVYEFRYVGENTVKGIYTVPTGVTGEYVDLPALFTGITIPGTVDNDALAELNDIDIVVTAQAIQADGFVDTVTDDNVVIATAEENAWAAFGA